MDYNELLLKEYQILNTPQTHTSQIHQVLYMSAMFIAVYGQCFTNVLHITPNTTK